MKDYFSKDLQSLIEGLTQKNQVFRLGHPTKGGVNQIKRHPFFAKLSWDDVYNKKLKPPIVPEKKKGVQDMISGEANPYRLLEQNFDKNTVLEPVQIFEETRVSETGENRPRAGSDASHGNISMFTYER
jgi:hypothetical protein